MISIEEFKKKLLAFTVDMYNDPAIPRSVIDNYLVKVQNLLSDTIVPYLCEGVQMLIANDCSRSICGAVNAFFQDNRFPFDAMLTEKNCVKLYKKANIFVQPEKHVVGHEKIFVIVDFLKIEVEYVRCEIVHVPLKRSLTLILETSGLIELIDRHLDELENEDD
ncbi:hypothetical protein QAD02_012589 [Eretmocerus hayati]|uniref:Uncharacterized protein n=1 Tax=Eretmocerus hayati TaxID=131215 RepID=A0ACC2P088_9HYME|nr:hypothetical protein QAD02_012589 [Eretmocerus hayati]